MVRKFTSACVFTVLRSKNRRQPGCSLEASRTVVFDAKMHFRTFVARMTTLRFLLAAGMGPQVSLIDSSRPYDSSMWRRLKAALWQRRKGSLLRQASEV